MTDNRPWPEQYYDAAQLHAKLDAAATIMEELKSTKLSQMMQSCGDIAVSKAEMISKASPEWEEYIKKMVAARNAANKAKIDVEYLRMQFKTWENEQFNNRVEARL